MGAIRTLYTDLKLRSTDALKGLVAYGKQWQAMDKIVANAATSIERNADRVAAALTRVAAGAANVRTVGVGRPTRAPRASAPRSATRTDNAIARQAGLADGAKAIKDATAALGPLATKSDRAKASIADLAAQVARNRKEMSDLRAEAVRTGDSEGTLKSRMQGLAVTTGQASVALSNARNELRAIDGGFLKAVKSATLAKVSVVAVGTAFGNLITGAVSGAWHGVTGAIVGATDKAIKFESSLVAISKVARGADDTKEGFDRITAGIKGTSRELGVLPTEVANLTAQLAPVFSDVSEGADGAKVDLVALTADVTKVGVAWDISGAQAGKAFADISRGLGTTTAETKSLFGGINELGNQLGTNAATVAEALQRSAGVLKGASISGETGAALNATLIATGASAEVAATGVRTFIGRLGAGETKGQLAAFKALNLDMASLRKNMANGGAEQEIKKVVKALGGLENEDRLNVLTQLFGTESIGSIGAAATATELLGKSFDIMGNKAASATSVQKEFDRVGETTASKVAKLKANVEVLAIEFGEALLPHINKVVEFLTSPEGKEWGADAVEKAVGAVTTLASAVGSVIGFFSGLVDVVGGATSAFGAMGLALIALTGPYGAVLVGATALGAYITTKGKDAIDVLLESTEQASSNLLDVASGLTTVDGALGVTSGILAQLGSSVDANTRQWAGLMLSIFGTSAALQEFNDNEAKRRGLTIEKGRAGEDEARRAAKDAESKAYAQRTQAADEASRAAIFDRKDGRMPTPGRDGQTRFDELSAKVRAGKKLRPSEATEYTKLSKSLDEAKASKAGKGKVHKQTKMDRRLAGIGSDVRGVLTSGGEMDAGGDLKVHDDVLSRSVFDRATKGGAGGKDRSDGAGIGPGPNVSTTYQYVNTTVTVPIDARSSASVSDNIRNAANQAGQQLGGVVFTGATKLLAQKNAGGVMRSG